MDNGFTNIDQLITDYVKGDLHSEVLAMFEAKLQWNKELQEKVALEREMRSLFLDADTLILKELMTADLAPKESVVNNKKWWLGGLGLAIILTSGLLLLDDNEEPLTIKESAVSVIQEEMPTNEINEELIIEELPEIDEHSKREIHTVKPEHFNEKKSPVFVVDTLLVEKEILDEDIEPSVDLSKGNTVGLEQETRLDPCLDVTFQGDLKIKKAQRGLENGVVTLHQELISGGLKPYQFSMSERDFSDQSIFEGLSAEQQHRVYIKDANACVALLNGGSFQIPSTECVSDYQATFSISYEQDWLVPVNDFFNAEITLLNRVGAEMFKNNVEEGEIYRWDGIFENSNKVIPGRYNWLIEYEDGEQCVVKMTVVN